MQVLDTDLLRRIRGEFLEMPGLRLTCAQAQRLWGLDVQTCALVLEQLVDVQFLIRASDGRYMRPGDAASQARNRMLKAEIDDAAAAARARHRRAGGRH